ncbi:uncharacterized protein LOC11175967 [Anopheles gambiae]|uniref:DUF4794 domain-containing protein n=1 Tax=Anopheles coluzzii TaxID=1518534 RepID=A0A6E8W9K2_ANOCL|nr:uncharacterized protein LOC11175967 [Anopheles gambiae]XP_040224567.2 uncharacterized protein LOC120950523 [Anopheles coluzzii]
MTRTVIVLFALVAVVAAEPPLRFRPRAASFAVQRPNVRFARLEDAPPAAEQPAGYHYPKPMSAGYHYPKPDQAFPLPGEEMPPAFTTEQAPAAETTTPVQEEQSTTTESSDTMTTTAAYEDYEDATGAPEPTADDTNVSAKLRRRQQLNARRPAPLTLVNRPSQRLEELPAAVYVADQEQQQQQQVVQQRPVYLISLPESTLQQLVLLNNAQLAGLQVAPQPTAVYLSELDYIYKKK